MSANKALTLLFWVLVIAPSGICQKGKTEVNKETGQWERTPEMAEKMKRQRERLLDPSFIKLEIVPVSNCQDEEAKKVSGCYQAHRKIRLELFMTNMSLEPIRITISDSYYHYNLQLFRDSELVPYRKGVAEAAAKPSMDVYRNISVKLEPGKRERVDTIPLPNWYGPVEPGHYQLDIRRRFLPDGGWTETATTTFEVEPE